jgi:hypothetical protein
MITVYIKQRDPKKFSYHFYKNNDKLRYKEGIKLLQTDPKFRTLVTNLLKKSPFKTFIWKLTAINRKEDFNRDDKYFKFTIQENKNLDGRVGNSERFNEYLNDPKYDVLSSSSSSAMFSFFESLSGNGMLVPKKLGPDKTYVHFSNFIRLAPNKQVDEFWKIFSTMIIRIIKSPCKLYINTHGLDVPWLHVRFDKVPDKIKWTSRRSLKKE